MNDFRNTCNIYIHVIIKITNYKMPQNNLEQMLTFNGPSIVHELTYRLYMN